MSKSPLLGFVVGTTGLLLLAACGDSHHGGGGMDAGHDGGVIMLDAGHDTGTPPPPDGGPTDAGTRPDAHFDAGPVPEGCDPVSGIECDGDWSDRCTPACAASQC